MNYQSFTKDMLNILLDNRCIFCNSKRLNRELNFICRDCLEMFRKPSVASCQICGHPLRESSCPSCPQLGNIYYDSLDFIQYYTGYLKKVTQLWKREENFLINRLFLHLMIEKGIISPSLPLTVVPDTLPGRLKKGRRGLTHLLKLLKGRGYKILKPPYHRRSFTFYSQKTKGGKARIDNIERQYYLPAAHRGIYNGDIQLIDDIYTTGSTLNYGAKLLKEAGFKRVHVISFFRSTMDNLNY